MQQLQIELNVVVLAYYSFMAYQLKMVAHLCCTIFSV